MRISPVAPFALALSLLAVAAIPGGGCTESPRPVDGRADGRVPDGGRDSRIPFQFPEAGDLFGPDRTPFATDACLGAKAVALSSSSSSSGGKAVVSGSTAGASNEYGDAVRCGGPVPLSGPQRYHKVTMTAGNVYQVTLAPQFAAVMYLFSACSKNIINVDCTSGGATGAYSGAVAAGASATITFLPPATGDYYVAVDSASTSATGTYTLTVVENLPPKNMTCTAAQALTLSGGKVSVSGTTLGAVNQFQKSVTCNTTVDFDGPQVFYTVSLQKGAWYRITLSAQFAAAVWVAGGKTGCASAKIEQDCGGVGGTVLPLLSGGASASTWLRAVLGGTYLVAVDSPDPQAAGTFTLGIEEVTPAGNAVCAGATAVALVNDKATIVGSTSTSLNDSGASVTCGGTPLLGPQAYYTLALGARAYRLDLTAGFDAALVLGQGCLTLDADCRSGGLTGTVLRAKSGKGTLRFTPASAGSYLLAVEGADTAAAGTFRIDVQAEAAPTYGACITPRALALPAASPLTELGDTSPLSNDLTGVSCGNASGPWPGPQAYYKVALKGGTTYAVKLTPEAAFDPSLYALPAATSCTAAAVNQACAGSALSSDIKGSGKVETVTITPTQDADWLLVVDSWSPSEVGRFTLTVAWP